MKYIAAILFIIVGVASYGAETEKSDPEDVYVFWGVDVSAVTKTGFAPVVSADRKGLYVETDKGVKRQRFSARYRIAPKMELVKQLIEISDFEIDFGYAQRNVLEAQAMSDVLRSESIAEGEIALLSASGGSGGERRISQIMEKQSDLEESVRDSIRSGDYDSMELKDTMNLKMSMLSPIDVKNAYCVVMMQYIQPDQWDSNKTKTVSTSKIQKVGDLREGIPAKVKLNFRVPEGYLKGAEWQFYLLSGANENLGTTISSGLRRLSEEEISKLEKLNESKVEE